MSKAFFPTRVFGVVAMLALTACGQHGNATTETQREHASLSQQGALAAPGYLDWIIWLLWPVFVLLALLGLFFGFTLLANLIGSPFNGLLAERVERLVDPESHPPDSLSLATELFSAPLEELRKLMHVFLLAVPLILLWLVPPAYPFLPFLWAAFGAWVLAL